MLVTSEYNGSCSVSLMKIKLRRTALVLLTFSVSLFLWHCGPELLSSLSSMLAPESRKEVHAGPNLELTTPRRVNSAFSEGFYFPQPRVMKSLAEIEASPWMISLHSYLRSLDHSLGYIYLLTSNFKYIDVLLNWLISAVIRSNVDIQNILIISMDYATHNLLSRHKFHSVFISPSFIFSPTSNFSEPFEEVMMLRLVLMRIINHFGFSVAMFDTDAIMLRDPKHLFIGQTDVDIVGSVGTIPDDLFAEWGVTICIGVVLVRNSVRTEEYWNGMKDIHQECVDDQGKLNYGLKALDIKWHSNSNHQNITVHGRARNNLRVSILPYDDICRLDACVVNKRGRYYIWHKGGHRTRKKKLNSAREGKVWFLQYKWNNIHNDFVGKEWLRSIAYLGVTMDI